LPKGAVSVLIIQRRELFSGAGRRLFGGGSLGGAGIGGGISRGTAAGLFRDGRWQLEEAAAAELEVGGGVFSLVGVLKREGFGARTDAKLRVRRRRLHD